MNDVKTFLINFNRGLDDANQDSNLNEHFIAKKYKSLLTVEDKVNSYIALFWISMSKLMELTLICAGNFADNGFIKEVGYLLFKPREVVVHIDWESIINNIDLSTIKFDDFVDFNKRKLENNLIEVLLKHYSDIVVDRNRTITEQFEVYKPKNMDIKIFLRDFTKLKHTKKPLLPELKASLEASGYFSESYFSSVKKRIDKIVTAITCTDMRQDLKSKFLDIELKSTQQRHVLKSSCNFDRQYYNDMCHLFNKIVEDKKLTIKYIL